MHVKARVYRYLAHFESPDSATPSARYISGWVPTRADISGQISAFGQKLARAAKGGASKGNAGAVLKRKMSSLRQLLGLLM